MVTFSTTASVIPDAVDPIKDLVDRSVDGDAEAFGELYERYVNEIYRYFYHHVGDACEAEDLAERTFLKVWQSINRYRWQGKPFTAWLYTLAHNEMVDYFRAKRPKAPLDERQPYYGAGPDDLAIQQQAHADVRRALQLLTPDQRQLIVLKFYMEKDNREIAAIMGKKEGTVRALQMRALAALRRKLQNEQLAAA
jgi:RNA polymerase sigma-70 factor (ECF subfamily)